VFLGATMTSRVPRQSSWARGPADHHLQDGQHPDHREATLMVTTNPVQRHQAETRAWHGRRPGSIPGCSCPPSFKLPRCMVGPHNRQGLVHDDQSPDPLCRGSADWSKSAPSRCWNRSPAPPTTSP